MKKYQLISILMLVFCLVIYTGGVMAGMTGEEIMDKVDETLDADSVDSNIKMTIVNKDGQERLRTIQIMSKGNDRALVKFLEPADVEGTTFLTITDENDEDHMWLYLPALGNVRKIASHMKNGSFMGTDFTYNDISMVGGSDYRDNYDSTLKGEEVVNGDDCYLLETVPTDEDIDYSKMMMWVRKSDYMPLKLEFYDEDGELVKVMTNSDITDINGHLTPQNIVMENVQEGTKTILELKNIKYNVDIPDNIFTTRYMQKG